MNTKALLAEFIGTFFLVFIGAGAVVVTGDLVIIALAHGLVIVSMAYAYGSISGAHLNPAVTFAMALRGRMDWTEAGSYWVTQLLGGVAAAGALMFIFGGADFGLGQTAPAVPALQAVVLEGLMTFMLVNVVLHTTGKKTGTPFAGLAIGFTLAAAILFGGLITGASLNPARSFGPALFTNSLDSLWIYFVGPLAGAAVAAGAHQFFTSKKKR
jgi:MIP family channel proteins